MKAQRAPAATPPVTRRLSSLTPLDAAAEAALLQAASRSRLAPPRRDLLTEGEEIEESLLIVSGWAARFRQLADGRRQILSLLLPGDLIGLCNHPRPLANSSVVAVTAVELCTAPERGLFPALDQAYALSRALEEAYLVAQITRLGRLNAYERTADLLLEMFERLELAGLAADGRYHLPLTQEWLADALGLTAVHVNRTLQSMRRGGDIALNGRDVVIANPASLYRQLGRIPPKIAIT